MGKLVELSKAKIKEGRREPRTQKELLVSWASWQQAEGPSGMLHSIEEPLPMLPLLLWACQSPPAQRPRLSPDRCLACRCT